MINEYDGEESREGGFSQTERGLLKVTDEGHTANRLMKCVFVCDYLLYVQIHSGICVLDIMPL